MKKFLLLLFLFMPVQAEAAVKTPAQILTEINSGIVTNSTGAINAPILAQILGDITSSAIFGTNVPNGFLTYTTFGTVNTWTATQIFNPAAGNNQAISAIQILNGAQGSSFNANSIVLTDNANISGPNFLNGLTIAHTAGVGFTGGRQTLLSALIVNGTPGLTGNSNFISITPSVNVSANLRGTGVTWSTANGGVFATNPSAIAQFGATNLLELAGAEVNIALQTGASAYAKFGWSVVALASDVVQGSVFDAGYELRGQVGSVGFQGGLLFDDLAGNARFPVATTGTVIWASVAGVTTVANGIDFGGLTISGYSFKFPYATLSGAGVLNLSNMATGTPAASVCIDVAGNLVKKTTVGSCI